MSSPTDDWFNTPEMQQAALDGYLGNSIAQAYSQMTDAERTQFRARFGEEDRCSPRKPCAHTGQAEGYRQGGEHGVSNLMDFLLGAIAEDEWTARAAIDAGPTWRRAERAIVDDHDEFIVYDEGRPSAEQADHITTWDPARVLAECDAKRRIIGLHQRQTCTSSHVCGHAARCSTCADDQWPCATLVLLALPNADRPGYRKEWAP